MKRIEAIIKPFKLEEIKEILNDAGISTFHVVEIKSFVDSSRQEIISGTEYQIGHFSRSMLVLYVEDTIAEEIARILLQSASTGHDDDGWIAITPLDTLFSIDTGSKKGESES